MKNAEGIVEILEAFDLTGSFRAAATAAVDRLLHHAHVVVTEGGSHRLAGAVEGRGVRSLRPET